MTYAEMGVIDLRRLVRERGLASGGAVASARKDDLIALLEGTGKLAEQALPAAQDVDLATIIAQAVSGKVRAGLDAAAVAGMIEERLAEQAAPPIDQEKVAQIVRDEVAKLTIPQTIEVKNAVTGEVKNIGVQHKRFKALSAFAQARDKDGHVPPIYLHGPAGTGKTTAARKLAEALGLEFYFNGAIDSEYKLSGFVDAQGVFRSRPFYEAYHGGGVYLFDELDSSLPGAVLAFNAALANGHADFPTGQVVRHQKCIIIAAGNTCLRGDGLNAGYQRVEMDAAFRDRFVFIDWPLDETLEEAFVPPEYRSWLQIVRSCRANVAKHGVKKADVTPRATFAGIALLKVGVPVAAAVEACIRKGLPEAQWALIVEGNEF